MSTVSPAITWWGAPIVATIAALVLALSAVANAQTDADWAWPGMQYDIEANNIWRSCSVGFPAWNNAGTRYFISAGHCFRTESGSHYQRPGGIGVDIYAPADHFTPVGFERTYTIPDGGMYDDVSLVEMYPGRTLGGNGWEHIPDSPAAAAVGDQVCLAGSRHTSTECGAVTGTHVHQGMDGYPWTEDVATASFCAYPGDSGGAVYNNGGAIGIEITVDAARNASAPPGACRSSFVPIEKALAIFRHDNPSLTI